MTFHLRWLWYFKWNVLMASVTSGIHHCQYDMMYAIKSTKQKSLLLASAILDCFLLMNTFCKMTRQIKMTTRSNVYLQNPFTNMLLMQRSSITQIQCFSLWRWVSVLPLVFVLVFPEQGLETEIVCSHCESYRAFFNVPVLVREPELGLHSPQLPNRYLQSARRERRFVNTEIKAVQTDISHI